MVEDNEEEEISAIHLSNSHLREQPKKHGCLSPPTTEPTTEPITEPVTEPTTSLVDRPISPSIALYRDSVEQIIYRDNCEAAVTIYPFYIITITLPLLEQP